MLTGAHNERTELPPRIATIGVGYDGSRGSAEALAFARRLAAALGARLRVLEVVCPPRALHASRSGAALGKRVDLLLCEARERLADLDGVEGSAVYGIAEEELAAFAEEVDLLVIGPGGESAACCPERAAGRAGTCEYLRHHARCPVLVVPGPASVGRLRRGRAFVSNSRGLRRRDECCIG